MDHGEDGTRLEAMLAGMSHASKEGNKGGICSIRLALEVMTAEERAQVQAWLDDPSVKHSWVAKALKDGGFVIGRGAIARHRRGECRCE